MTDKVIAISNEVYPITDILKDVTDDMEKLKDILIVVVYKDGTSAVCHTGLTLAELAISSKMVEYEFNKIYAEHYLD